MITPTGKNLTIVISSENNSLGDWLSFSLWYTIQKYWPDSRVVISLTKTYCDQLIYRWLDRCKVRRFWRKPEEKSIEPLLNYELITKPVLLVPCYSIMTREANRNELEEISSTKFVNQLGVELYGNGDKSSLDFLASENIGSLFLRFEDQIGSFNISTWNKHAKIAPFGASWEPKTTSERFLMTEWTSMFSFHDAVRN